MNKDKHLGGDVDSSYEAKLQARVYISTKSN